MTFLKFNHLITTKPHHIREVFISDLHLSEEQPALTKALLALLDDLAVLPNLKKLYILGDWFEVWIGDDAYIELSEEQKNQHWITPIVKKLRQLRINGCQIFIMHGNRDFLIRQPFCDTFSGQLISEPTLINIGKHNVRLEHGDALCTDDKRYQKFRKYSRNQFVQWWLLHKPLAKRVQLANKLRNRSKQENAHKSNEIMDVNEQAVTNVMTDVDFLIHGHTHRPAVHDLHSNDLFKNDLSGEDASQKDKTRYVLGDWRVNNQGGSHEQVNAVIGVVYEIDNTAEFALVECEYKTKH